MRKSYRLDESRNWAIEFFYNSQVPTGRKFKKVENVAEESLRTKETVTIKDPVTGHYEKFVLELLG